MRSTQPWRSAFALAVVEPKPATSAAAGSCWCAKRTAKAEFVDYRETAPAKASRDMYLRPDGTVDAKASVRGYQGRLAFPARLPVLRSRLSKYGTMKLPDVMAPAIRLAEEGFPVSERRAGAAAQPAFRNSAVCHEPANLLKDGDYYQPGEILKQPELGATLRRIAKDGAAEFYHGRTAHDLAGEMKEEGGLITLDDLAHYQAQKSASHWQRRTQ